MIIEDNPTTVSRYKKELGDAYTVDFFLDAHSALIHYPKFEYDLVITDLMLPLKSGESLIFDIKYMNPYQKVAVISSATESLKLKSDHNIPTFYKPISIKNVIETLLFGKANSTQSLGHFLNQRRHPRTPVEIEIRIAYGKSKEFTTLMSNLSLGGALIRVPSTKSKNEKLILKIPMMDKIVTVEAIKRWRRAQGGKSNIAELGVEFSELDHTSYSMIDRYLELLNQTL